MATWQKRAGLALLAGAVAGAGLGAAPKLKSSWRNFDQAATPVSKVIVIGFTTEQATRRTMEDSLTAEIRRLGGKAEPSYTLVPGALPKEPSAMKEKVVAAGFDGAVVVRVAGVRQEQAWDPGYVAAIPTTYGTVWTVLGLLGSVRLGPRLPADGHGRAHRDRRLRRRSRHHDLERPERVHQPRFGSQAHSGHCRIGGRRSEEAQRDQVARPSESSEKTSAWNREILAPVRHASDLRPAFRHVCDRKVSRSHPCSAATWGRSRPRRNPS